MRSRSRRPSKSGEPIGFGCEGGESAVPIDKASVRAALEQISDREAHLRLEMTNGAYAVYLGIAPRRSMLAFAMGACSLRREPAWETVRTVWDSGWTKVGFAPRD